ncbi:TIGR02117 family protein [soil metagenome]
MRAAALLLAIFLSGCSTLPRVVPPAATTPRDTRDSKIFVTTNGWHTGIVVEADKLNALVPEFGRRFPSERYYEIGWGDAGFYRSKKITAALALKATLGANNPTVLHVVAFHREPAEYFGKDEVLALRITPDGYRSLLAYIASSLHRPIQSLGPGIYGESEFYIGVGNYFLFNTCNTWTTKALASSGAVPRHAYKLTSGAVLRMAQNSPCALHRSP